MRIWTGNRVRLERARSKLESLEPRTRHQRALKPAIETALLMAELWSVPGSEARFEKAWELVELLRKVWDLPRSRPGPPQPRPRS